MTKKIRKRGSSNKIRKKQAVKKINKKRTKNKLVKAIVKTTKPVQETLVSAQKIYTTEIDRFYDFINKSKKISLKQAAKKFGINKKTAEEWSKILQEHNLIEIAYPVFGGPELRWKK